MKEKFRQNSTKYNFLIANTKKICYNNIYTIKYIKIQGGQQMANVEETTITINSEVLTPGQLEEKRQKVKRWQNYGYSKMAIFYFLSKEVKTLSATCSGNEYVINLG